MALQVPAEPFIRSFREKDRTGPFIPNSNTMGLPRHRFLTFQAHRDPLPLDYCQLLFSSATYGTYLVLVRYDGTVLVPGTVRTVLRKEERSICTIYSSIVLVR